MRTVVAVMCALLIPISVAAGSGQLCVRSLCVVSESVTYCEASQTYRFRLVFSIVPRLDVDCSGLDERRLDCPIHAFAYNLPSSDVVIGSTAGSGNFCEVRRYGQSIGTVPYQLKDTAVTFHVSASAIGHADGKIPYELYLMTDRMATFHPLVNHSIPGTCKDKNVVPMQRAPQTISTWGKIKSLFR